MKSNRKILIGNGRFNIVLFAFSLFLSLVVTDLKAQIATPVLDSVTTTRYILSSNTLSVNPAALAWNSGTKVSLYLENGSGEQNLQNVSYLDGIDYKSTSSAGLLGINAGQVYFQLNGIKRRLDISYNYEIKSYLEPNDYYQADLNENINFTEYNILATAFSDVLSAGFIADSYSYIGKLENNDVYKTSTKTYRSKLEIESLKYQITTFGFGATARLFDLLYLGILYQIVNEQPDDTVSRSTFEEYDNYGNLLNRDESESTSRNLGNQWPETGYGFGVMKNSSSDITFRAEYFVKTSPQKIRKDGDKESFDHGERRDSGYSAEIKTGQLLLSVSKFDNVETFKEEGTSSEDPLVTNNSLIQIGIGFFPLSDLSITVNYIQHDMDRQEGDNTLIDYKHEGYALGVQYIF